MPPILTEVDLQTRHRRKRRWLVGVVLGLLLLLLGVGILLALSLSPSAMSIENAQSVFEQLGNVRPKLGEQVIIGTRKSQVELEALLGKPHRIDQSRPRWHFVRQSWNTVEWLEISVISMPNNDMTYLGHFGGTLTGRDAWNYRWNLLKERFGAK